MTERKRRQNLAKCFSVRFEKLKERQRKCSEVFEVAQVAGKKSSDYWL